MGELPSRCNSSIYQLAFVVFGLSKKHSLLERLIDKNPI